MAFNQTYHHVNRVYNVEGTLILSETSDINDLAAQVANIREAVARDTTLPAAEKQVIDRELEQAESQAQEGKPEGESVKAHLDRAATTLQSAENAASRASGLARTLFDIGKWAAALLA